MSIYKYGITPSSIAAERREQVQPSIFNIDRSRSYATEDNLMQALTKLGFVECRPLVVRNREGRFTAVFAYGQIQHIGVRSVAEAGFMVLG